MPTRGLSRQERERIYTYIYTHIYMHNILLMTDLYMQKIFLRRRVCMYAHTHIYIYRMSHEECARFREGVPYVKVYRYNPKHLCPKLNGYGDNCQRSLKL